MAFTSCHDAGSNLQPPDDREGTLATHQSGLLYSNLALFSSEALNFPSKENFAYDTTTIVLSFFIMPSMSISFVLVYQLHIFPGAI